MTIGKIAVFPKYRRPNRDHPRFHWVNSSRTTTYCGYCTKAATPLFSKGQLKTNYLKAPLAGIFGQTKADITCCPTQFKPRILTTLIDEQSGEASLELALSVAEHFRLNPPEARQIARKVAQAVGRWRQEADALKIPAAEIEMVASAFEHEDLAKARALRTPC